MAVRTYVVDKESPFMGDSCALCKEPFAPGDEMAVCPEDATRHHSLCWRANGNKCTALGCSGNGILLPAIRSHSRINTPPAGQQREPRSGNSGRRSAPRATVIENASSKVRALPTTSVHVAQSCLLLSIAIALIFFAIGCFGLWAIADFIAMDVLGWQYRAPLGGIIQLLPTFVFTLLLP